MGKDDASESRKAVKVLKKGAPKARAPSTRTVPEEVSEPVFDVGTHVFVPKHALCTVEEKKQLLATYCKHPLDLPKIRITDPAIRGLAVKQGDIVKIHRQSLTAGEVEFYRIVVNE